MLISKIYNSLDESKKEEFVEGLVWGLVWGLAGGIVWGLVWGLAGGIVWGLVWGLAGGIVWGLAGGFVVILINFAEAFPFIQGLYPILLIIIGILLLTELMFWLTKDKKPKKNIFWYVCRRKGENILEILLVLSGISQVYILTREIDFIRYFPIIVRWIGYIGVILIILGSIAGMFYLWIKLNMKKYG